MNPTPVNLDEPLIPKSRNQTISSDYKYLEDPDGEFSRPGETLHKQPTVTIHEGYEQLPEKKNKSRKREARWSVKLPFLQIHKHKHPDFVPLDVQKKPLTLIYDFVNYQKEHEELRAGSESASTASEPPSPTERLRRSQSNMMVSGLQKLKTSISHTYHEKLLHGKTCREFLKGRGIAIWHKMKKPIRPDHPLRIAWDVMLITLVLIDMVILPLNVAFEYPKGSLSFNIFNDVVFLLDIALSFNTAYYAYGNLVVDRRRIAKNYVRSWLFLDVLAAFPFSAFEYVADWESRKGHISYLRLVKVVKIIRAIKFFKLNRIFFKLKILFSSSPKWTSFFQFLQLMIVVMIMAHWLGCGWYLMAILEVQFTGVDNNWIVMKGIQDLDLGGLYAYSVYWAFTTMLTVGYGDVVPATTQEVIYSIIAMLIGCSIFAYALGGVSSIIQAFGQDKDNMSANSYAMDRFLNHFKLEPELTSRIRGYMQHLIEGEHKKTKYKEQFLDLMTDNLRKDILVAIHGDALAQNRVFKDNFGQRFLKEVSHELEEMTFCDGDPVYTEDTLDTAFYMITKGRMGIYIHGEDHPVRMLQSGDYFGELSFFSGDRRTMTIRSSNYSQVFAIHQEAFLSIMERYEDDKETYHEICDKIRLYHDYSALHMRCVACAHHTHSVRYCPMLNYRPSVQEIVESIEEDKRAFLESFTRRPGGKFHARSNLQELRKAVEQLRDDFEERHNYRNRHSANSKVVKSNSLRAMDTMFRAQQTGFRFSAEPKVGGVQKPSIFNLPANVKKASVDSLPSEQMDRKAPSLKSLKEMAEYKEEDRDGESTPKAIINEVNHIEEYCRKHNIDLPEGSMGQLLNSIMASKQKEQEVVVFDQVKSFKNYFKHNNVEEVVRRLNSLNKVGFFNHLKEEKEEPLALEIVLFEPSSNPRKMSSTYPDHKAMTKLNEKEFTDQGPLVIRRVKSCETH